VEPRQATAVLVEAAESLIGDFSSTLPTADPPIVDLADLLAIIASVDTAVRDLRSAVKVMKARAHRALDARGEQRVVLPNGIVAERSGGWQRTKIDREGLMKFVRKCAELEDLRIDPRTGEMRTADAVALELHCRCFRPEPKWTELKTLGVNEEDFCSREFTPSVRIMKAEVLA
jgi:hypothetical protein